MMILCWDFLALRDRHPRFGAWDLGFGDRDAGFLAKKKDLEYRHILLLSTWKTELPTTLGVFTG